MVAPVCIAFSALVAGITWVAAGSLFRRGRDGVAGRGIGERRAGVGGSDMLSAGAGIGSDGAATLRPRTAEMTGFLLWLSARRVPLRRCTAIHREVERFLEWRDTQFARRAVPLEDAAWCYLDQLRRRPTAPTALHSTWAALDLYLSYSRSPAVGGLPVPSPRSSRL
jgi:hypothetical protein